MTLDKSEHKKVCFDSNNTSYHNSAIGPSALRFDDTSYHNSGIGTSTLRFNAPGSCNSTINASAFYSNNKRMILDESEHKKVCFDSANTSYYNSAIGTSALNFNTPGSYNSTINASDFYSNTKRM